MNRNYFIVGLVMFVFFVISFLTNIIGPLMTTIIDDFELSLTMAGFLSFAFFIAYGVFSIPSGVMIERYGEKKIMVWAFFMSFVGAVSLALYPGYLMLLVSLFFIGAGMAMLQVAINPLLRTAGGEEHFAFNSVMAQMFFGLASFLSPEVSSYLITNLDQRDTDLNFFLDALSRVVPENLSWISIYWLFAIISLLMVVVVKYSKMPSHTLFCVKVPSTSKNAAFIIIQPAC